MSSKSDFVLQLIDKLTGPASGMAKAMRAVLMAEEAVTAGAAAADAGLGKVGLAVGAAGARAAAGARGFDRAADALTRMNRAAAAARVTGAATGPAPRFDSLGMRIAPSASELLQHANTPFGPTLDRRAQRANLTPFQRFDVATQGIQKATKGLFAWNAAMGDSISKWTDMAGAFMKTPFGFVVAGLGKVAGGLLDVASAIGSALLTAGKLVVALGAIAAVTFTKQVVEMAAFAERGKRALGFITGSREQGQKEFAEAVTLSDKLGANVEETVQHYSKLRSMQFSKIESAGLVRLSKDLQAITGDSQAAERALTAMTQIKAKGKLQSEELVGQLAEAGVSTVLVYKELEKILNTDRKGVLAKLQSGSIDSETGLVAIVRALKAKYHVSSVGEIAEGDAANTMTGLWNSVLSAPGRALLRVGEQIDTTPVMTALRQLKDAFDGAFSDGSAVQFVNNMIAGLSQLIPLTIEFARGFGAGLGGIADALTGEASAEEMKRWARDAGESTARFFERVIEITKKVVPEVLGAIDALLEGMDINGMLEDMKGIDFAQLGKDMVIIAKALGEVTHYAAELATGPIAKAVVKTANVVAHPGDAYMDTATSLLRTIFGFGDSAAEEPQPEPGRPSSMRPLRLPERAGGGGSLTVGRVEVNVDARGSDDPEKVGEKTGNGVKNGLGDLLSAFAPRNMSSAM